VDPYGGQRRMKELIEKLIDEMGPGNMGSTAYDTAWAARLGEIDWNLSTQSLAWLAENQLPDGSWGARAPFYYHDRVICTLAAMIALSYQGRRGHDRMQVENGRLALERIVGGATQGLRLDANGATVGFEMIAPTLAAEAEKLGLIKNQGNRILGRLSRQRSKKLAYLQNNMINRHVTMAFSAEMAGTDGKHMLDIENLQESNGSVGLSPSATAYFAAYIKKSDGGSVEYLRRTARPDGGQPNVAPFDVFEIAWSLWNLGMIPGLGLTPKIKPHIDILSNAWEPGRGVSFATNYSVKDSDDSVITYNTLLRFGIEKDLASVLAYEEKDHFRCFDLEVNPSISANIHILHALRQAGLNQKNMSVQKIIHFLRKTKSDQHFWIDKWHSSTYYPTAHAIIACAGFADDLVRESVEWILESQNANGSWGTYIPTAEETAYALQALWSWNEQAANVPKAAFRNGVRWLEDHLDPPYPPLWIGKCLYNPRVVIRSAVLSALTLARQNL
jgi:halimadienyl-diphosphate synthase